MNEQTKTIYSIPEPVSAIVGPPRFRHISGRRYEIAFSLERTKENGLLDLELTFDSVVALKIVEWDAVSVEMIEAAYGEVVDFGETEWLRSLRSTIEERGVRVEILSDLRHIGIYFDQGPLYEFVCGSFTALGD